MQQEKLTLGIELGSTRIKGVLINEKYEVVCSKSFDWENKLENGFWTYDLKDVIFGVQEVYKKIANEMKEKYDLTLTNLGAIGFSAMMHGYLAFDKNDNLLTPFRTWRNTTTGEAARILSEKFSFNIPQRWSISHLYQAILNNEEHTKKVAFMTTLSGYVHYLLTGEKVLGVGDASGMFPIDSEICDFDEKMSGIFNEILKEKRHNFSLKNIFPKVLKSGENAGTLTEKGALLLDPTGNLKSGIPLCPPEGDAGTGMVATNSVKVKTGNISAGTSIFSMIVLEKALSKAYEEIDMVTTPNGYPVAMAHCNNCTNEINAWANIFSEMGKLLGAEFEMKKLYQIFYETAMKGEYDCGGLVAYNYLSGEPVTGFDSGAPLFVRNAKANFTLANFLRSQVYSAVATLKIGMDILTKEEKVEADLLFGHGGFFKDEGGQIAMADALNVPVAINETAGEGGAWGIAVLANYLINNKKSLENFLQEDVFKGSETNIIKPNSDGVTGFDKFIENYKKGFAVEKSAVEAFC